MDVFESPFLINVPNYRLIVFNSSPYPVTTITTGRDASGEIRGVIKLYCTLDRDIEVKLSSDRGGTE